MSHKPRGRTVPMKARGEITMPTPPMTGRRPMTQSSEKTNCLSKGQGSAMRSRSHANPLSRGHNSMKTSNPGQIRGAVNSTERRPDEPSDDCD